MDVGVALAAVRSAGTILEGLRAGERLEHVARCAGPDAVPVLEAATADPDPITAVAAVRALGAQGSNRAAVRLVALLDDDRPDVAEHASEALGGVPPQLAAVPPLMWRCAEGGFSGMLAQRTLETWAVAVPDAVHRAARTALDSERDPAARARLVETIGLVPGPAGIPLLTQVASDEAEAGGVRAAALAALGDALADPGCRATPDAVAARDVVVAVARSGGPLAPVADLALADETRSADESRPAPTPPWSDGLTVVQLFLHGDVDARLRHSGQGDTGGIATLLVHLGDALLRQDSRVGRVITLSGSAGHGSALTSELADLVAEEAIPEGLDRPGHHYVRIPLRGPSTGAATAWPRRVEARRGIRRVLRAAGRVDVVHLRMADVGSMVAAEVAAELGIPVVLTVAPDPQALVAAREAEGTLTRAAFGAADFVEHLWFRDRLLRRLAEQAEHLVLFPRPDVERSITQLVGLDLAARPGSVLVVGEGIDVRALERVAQEVRGELARSPATAAALDDLDDALAQLPAARRSLPLAVSVGRLAPVKGMADLVSSWLSDPALRCRCNLLIIGGDLDDPSPEEAAELARIHGLLAAADANGTDDDDDGAVALASAGVVLAGHRPNATTTTWLAAAQRGNPGTSAPGGVYVCASLKEEFGIAILEAMAVGLVAVAPDGGGPATYVEHGVTGILTDPTHREALATDVGRALDLASSPSAELGALRSRAVVRERFGIDRMADALTEVYVRVASAHVDEPGPVGAIR